MVDKTMQYKFNRWFYFLLIILCSGCSALSDKKSTPFDPEQVNTLNFKFEDNSNTLSVDLPQTEITKTVVSNLKQWGYSFDSNSHDHLLTINISDIRHGSTPAGFSFNIGNSDPRAMDFQKADVISLTCALMPKHQTSQRAELVMEVMADELTELAKQPELDDLNEQLSDDISTTCFNLLNSLDIKTISVDPGSTSNTTTPSWIPEIRIEIENVPEESGEKVSPAANVNTTDNANGAMDNITVETESVKTPKKEPRKRIIIHNQGSPVIFKFGHERK